MKATERKKYDPGRISSVMYLLLCPCIHEPGLRAMGITHEQDLITFSRVLERCRIFGIQTRFLPCLETVYLGENHPPGYYLGRLDTGEFTRLLEQTGQQVRDMIQKEGMPTAIIGVDSSPVCGVHTTWYGSADPGMAKREGRGVLLSLFPDIPAYDVYDAASWCCYLAAPLFSEAERDFNRKIRTILGGYSYNVYLPQETGDCKAARDRNEQSSIFTENLKHLEEADLVIAVIDGADADSGTSWEIGYAYAKRKKIISIRTDFRKVGEDESVNLMLEESSLVVQDIHSLIQVLPCPLQNKQVPETP